MNLFPSSILILIKELDPLIWKWTLTRHHVENPALESHETVIRSYASSVLLHYGAILVCL
jgi:hypothetical protein